MSESFQVVFTGELIPGKDVDQVIQIFSEKFKVERGKAELLIRGGRAVVLKKGLELEKASKYLSVLQHIGMVVELNPKPVEAAAPQAAVTPPEPALAERSEPEAPTPELSTPGTSVPGTPADSKSELALEPMEPLDNGGDDTTEVLDPQSAIDQCPKCGSHRMELGICQDCGIVASKFLAAQARTTIGGETEAPEEDANPYSAPEAELVQPMEGEMDGPHKVAAGHGWAWIVKGWWHFKEAPLAWILVLVVWFVLAVVLSIVPLIGPIAVNLMTPVITGGLMYGCYEQDQGGDFSVSHLFSGFSNNAGQLVLVGVFYFVLMLLVSGVIMISMFSFIGMGAMSAEDPNAMVMAMLSPGFFIAILVASLLFIPIMMAYVFAPALVILDDVNALTAMKMSFMGCLKNMLPLTIYGLIAFLLMILGAIPFALGLLVVIPMLTASIYSAYRDIYFS